MEIRLQPKQKLLLEAVQEGPGDLRTIVFGGARGGAKSYGARAVALIRAMKNPGSSTLILRKSFPELIRNHIHPIFAEFPELRRFYNTSTKILTIPHKAGQAPSTIEFQSANDDGRLKRFQGAEYQLIVVDEATQFVEDDLTWLRMTIRSSSKLDVPPRMVLTANPGGPGHAMIKRWAIDKNFRSYEDPTLFEFIPAFVHDNIEWVRPALEKDGIDEETYYSWDDDKRMEYCLSHEGYGKTLASMPPKLRAAHLYGDWTVFAGQYFDVFDPVPGGRHVKAYKDMGLDEYSPRWIGMDWGFAHDSAVYYLAYNGSQFCVYREQCQNETSIKKIGQMIGETSRAMGEKISDVYLSHDAFARKQDEHTLALELGDELLQYGIRRPTKGVSERVAGWRYIYDLFASDRLVIEPSCKKLIECLPTLIRDEDHDPEDVLKIDGDDPADALRYGLMSRLRAAKEPDTETKIIAEVAKAGPQSDHTFTVMLARRAEAKFGRSARPVRPRARSH